MSVRPDRPSFACQRRRSALAPAGVLVAALLAATSAWAGPKIDAAAPTHTAGGDLQIVARITAKGKVFQPYLCYRTTRADFKVVQLKKGAGIDWTGTIPAHDLSGSKVDYYLGAYDATDLSEGLWHSKDQPATMALGSRASRPSAEAAKPANSGGYSDDATVATGDGLTKAPVAVAPPAETPPVFVPAPPAPKPAPAPKLEPAPKPAPPPKPVPAAKPPKPVAVPKAAPAPKPAPPPKPPKPVKPPPVVKAAPAPKIKPAKKGEAVVIAKAPTQAEEAPAPPPKVEKKAENVEAPPKEAKQEPKPEPARPAPAPAAAVKPATVAVAGETPLTVTGLPPNQGYLRVLTEPSRATVSLDGLDIGPAPMNKAIVAGEYLISAHLVGYRDESRVVTITAGSGKQIRLTLHSK